MTEPKDRIKLAREIDTLLIRVGKNYDNASHPALLITTHRDEILTLFAQEAEAIRKEERRRILAILHKEYPAIDTWQCYQALKQEE